MKKIFLILITILASVISNAQEKVNHNTARSNHSQGVMVREIKEIDCNRILNSKLFIKVSKVDTPDLHLHCCKVVSKSWEDTTAQAVKEASKSTHAKKHLFSKKNTVYYYNGDLGKLNKCKAQLKKANWIEILSYNRVNIAVPAKFRTVKKTIVSKEAN